MSDNNVPNQKDELIDIEGNGLTETPNDELGDELEAFDADEDAGDNDSFVDFSDDAAGDDIEEKDDEDDDDLDDEGTSSALVDDPLEDSARSKETVTNDAVAGETVLKGPDGRTDGPSGGVPLREPILPDNELSAEDIDLRDTPDPDRASAASGDDQAGGGHSPDGNAGQVGRSGQAEQSTQVGQDNGGQSTDLNTTDYDASTYGEAEPDYDHTAHDTTRVSSMGGDASGDDNINISESEGPNLEAGNDLDTGAGGRRAD